MGVFHGTFRARARSPRTSGRRPQMLGDDFDAADVFRSFHLSCVSTAPDHITGRANTNAASAAGSDQAHSPIVEIAIAAMMHPNRKPNRRYSDRFNRPSSALISGWPRDIASMIERTVFVRLPVMTAVDIALGNARRSSAY